MPYSLLRATCYCYVTFEVVYSNYLCGVKLHELFVCRLHHDEVESTEPKADAPDLYQLRRPREKAAQWLVAASQDTSTRPALP